MTSHREESLAEAALWMALDRRKPVEKLMHHSDRGSQYTSLVYQSENARANRVGKPLLFHMLFSTTPPEPTFSICPSLAEYLTLLSQENLLLHGGSKAEELTKLIKRITKASC